MIDIHNHVLPGIDDGSRNKEESFSILKKLNDIGFNTVICTPHYICGTRYNKNNRDKKILLNQIKSDLIKENSFGVSTTVDVDCHNCGEYFKASLNAVNFI